MTLRIKIMLALMVGILISVLGFAIVYWQARSLVATNARSNAAFHAYAASGTLATATQVTQLAVTQYLHSSAGADGQAMMERVAALTGLIGDGADLAAAAGRAFDGVKSFESSRSGLMAAVGSLASPVVTMSEIAANLPDPKAAQLVARISSQFGLATLGTLRFVFTGNRDQLTTAQQQLADLAKLSQALGLQPDLPPRLKKIAQIVDRNVAAVLAGIDEYTASTATSGKAIGDLRTRLSALSDGAGERLKHTSTDFQVTREASDSSIGSLFWTLLLAGSVALALGLATAVLLAGSIARPVAALAEVVRGIAEGNLTMTVPDQDRRDEIGVMASSIETLRAELDAAAAERAEQDRIKQAEIALVERRGRLSQDFASTMTVLASRFIDSAEQVRTASETLSATSQQTSAQVKLVAGSADQASVNVQTVASASEEMSASVNEINSQLTRAAEISDMAHREAEASNERMGKLTDSASSIGDVIKLIKKIADQTSLLALNATIEAARAGEVGKGFSIVASEVKQLAHETNKATDEIASRVAEIRLATSDSVSSMREIARVIAEVRRSTTAIASAVSQQSGATGEISRNCQQAALGTRQVTQSIFDVDKATASAHSSASNLMDLSSQLFQRSEDLKNTVEVFITDLAAA